jgi:hypothetical protein
MMTWEPIRSRLLGNEILEDANGEIVLQSVGVVKSDACQPLKF